MRNKIIFSFISCLLISFLCFGQKKFNEGKIIYTITYPDTELDAQTTTMMPTTMTLYVKGDKVRTETKMGMGMSNTTISDAKTKTLVSLMDGMGEKYAMKMTEADIKKMSGDMPAPEITSTGETKEIAGYKCEVSKVVITDKDGKKINSEICITKELKASQLNWHDSKYSSVDGIMLEYDIEQGPMKMRFKAKSIKEESVVDSMFDIPKDYQYKTLEELQQMNR